MTRCVRNFWVTANIDGRETILEGGPVNKSGGFSLGVKQRDNGSITQPVRVEGIADYDGNLKLLVFAGGEVVFEHNTKR